MSTETAKTTEQEQWVLAYEMPINGRMFVSTRRDEVFILTNDTSSDALTLTRKDPANVLIVSAYPGVVEQLDQAKNWIRTLETDFGASNFTDRHDYEGTCRCIADACESVLAAVHLQGDKT